MSFWGKALFVLLGRVHPGVCGLNVNSTDGSLVWLEVKTGGEKEASTVTLPDH